MSCHHCVHAVRGALDSIDGIKIESVEIGSATIDVQNDHLDLTTVREAIEEEGYTVVDG
jgi:copper chaperone